MQLDRLFTTSCLNLDFAQKIFDNKMLYLA